MAKVHACPIVSIDEIIRDQEEEVRMLANMIANYGYIVEYRKDPAFHGPQGKATAAEGGAV